MDDCQFIGSFNMGDPYTGVRYGSAAFRDLNVFVQGHTTKQSRDFFRDMLLRNVVHHPDKLDEHEILAQFSGLDNIFGRMDDTMVQDDEDGIEC